jgi:hypothetical protein
MEGFKSIQRSLIPKCTLHNVANLLCVIARTENSSVAKILYIRIVFVFDNFCQGFLTTQKRIQTISMNKAQGTQFNKHGTLVACVDHKIE